MVLERLDSEAGQPDGSEANPDFEKWYTVTLPPCCDFADRFTQRFGQNRSQIMTETA